MRFVEPAAGTIRINGIDIRDVPGDDVRRLIGLCAQDAYLFDSTLAENVRLARPGATDEDVLDALRTGPGSAIGSPPCRTASTPGSASTARGCPAASGSGCRSHACCSPDCPIVILDEPTEHLDEAEAARVLTDLFDATRDSVLIVITHRRRDLRLVDAVVDLAEVRAAPGEPAFIDVACR